ncbi:homeobox protein 3-like isoform X1 [Schistocerca gregaria]|uniref:homeobox protein 3-like isoform X1 n=1 Tax=Schistocerca gregaria TaxID=7010 RepID=UPI00211DFF13|nr:homeobox protein 3-like isoform X1 [Schistocerca gregaria]XP_049851320.1 homeobox protein 3-like isoform X1 [Schistocerca gregaria]
MSHWDNIPTSDYKHLDTLDIDYAHLASNCKIKMQTPEITASKTDFPLNKFDVSSKSFDFLPTSESSVYNNFQKIQSYNPSMKLNQPDAGQTGYACAASNYNQSNFSLTDQNDFFCMDPNKLNDISDFSDMAYQSISTDYYDTEFSSTNFGYENCLEEDEKLKTKLLELILICKRNLQQLVEPPAFAKPLTHDLNLDFLLDRLLITPRELATDASNFSVQKFAKTLETLKSWYRIEQKNLVFVCKQFVSWILHSMQPSIRQGLISIEEVKKKCALMASRFDILRLNLYNSITQVIILLYEKYGLNNRKRRQLPNTSTSVLCEWLDSHIDNPYPTDSEKLKLSKMSSLSPVQINTWFGNKRVRDPRLNLNRKGSNYGQNDSSPAFCQSPESDSLSR